MLTVPVEQLVGQMVGKYRIVRMLGSGAMNAVYIAQIPGSDQVVLLTAFIIPTTLSPQARDVFRKRFAQEALALARLAHPHILPLADFGEQFGYPYFVTPMVTAGSIAQKLKEQSRFTPMQTLAILKPVADALDYAHSKGVVHGSLKPVNFILDASQNIQIAGFGLTRMLALRDLEPGGHPSAHLLNIAGTFLGTAEYMAPEVIQGAPVAASADLYALGITLFELLSGKLPFSGTDPFEVANMHLVQPLPSIQAVYPDLPVALDMVIQSALEHDPARRVASATQLATVFERVLRMAEVATQEPSVGHIDQMGPKTSTDITLPPTVNWFDEGEFSKSGKWQVTTSATTKDIEQVDTSKVLMLQNTTVDPSDALWASRDRLSLVQTGKEAVMTQEHTMDPFAWWSATAHLSQDVADPRLHVDGPMTSVRMASPRGLSPKRPASAMVGRRKIIALIATGSVVAIVGGGGFSLMHLLQKAQPGNPQANTVQPITTTPSPTEAQPTPTQVPSPTAKTKATAKATAGATATTAPTPTPTPGHTGTVIGSTSQPINSVVAFGGNWLIHLGNGNFVAYRNSCTHEGVPLHYDAATQHLLCTRHNAAFNPASNGAVLYGPPSSPLPSVTIRVNGDGTITV